jgi:hypothetical protein
MAKKSRDEIDHYTLDQHEQEKYLGIGHERTKNLGHDWPESEIEQNPAGRVVDYTGGAGQREIKEGQRHTQGVYGRHSPTPSGIPSGENLQAWSRYSQSNTYSVDGRGRDPRGRSDSDGHLAPLPSASTETWADHRAGSESAPGRLEKIHRK